MSWRTHFNTFLDFFSSWHALFRSRSLTVKLKKRGDFSSTSIHQYKTPTIYSLKPDLSHISVTWFCMHSLSFLWILFWNVMFKTFYQIWRVSLMIFRSKFNFKMFSASIMKAANWWNIIISLYSTLPSMYFTFLPVELSL